MPNINLGSTSISKVYLGATSATKVYLGNTQIWVTGGGSTVTFQGILKSGTQILSNSATPVQVTGWVADGAFPGSVVTSDGITIVGNGTIVINTQLTSSTTNSNTWTMHIRKNGVQISPTYENITGGTGAGASTTDPFGGSFTTAVQNGDVITMWSKTQASTSNRRVIDATTTKFNLTVASSSVTVYGLERSSTFGPVADSASYTRVDSGWANMNGFTSADVTGGGITLSAGTYEFTARTEFVDYSSLTTQFARLVDSSGNVLASWSGNSSAGNFHGNISAPGGKLYLEISVQSSFADRRTLGTGSVMLFTK